MRLGRRILLATVAAAVQLAGGIAIVVYVPRHWGHWTIAVAGFYLSSLAGLALGEIVVGASPDPRKRWIAILTTAGLVGSGALIVSSLRAGSSSAGFVFLIPCVGVCVNLLASYLLAGRQATPTFPRVAVPLAMKSRWITSAAWLVTGSAATFVTWHAVVALVGPDHAVEPPLIADLRTLISAQAAYETANFGFDDTLECLQAPSRCLPGYPVSGPVFIESKPWLGTVGYFHRHFVPGAPVATGDLPAGASRSSLKGYAYVAVPAEPQGFKGFIWRRAGISLEGVRSFCADSKGRICVTEGGTEPRTVNGTCAPAPECRDLQ